MIKVKNLSYRFKDKESNTIKDITFDVQEGEIFGFLGPSRAGKSTTQKILIGLLGDYEGSVRVMETEVKKRTRDFYERIGVAFEFPNFYHKLSGYENLELFKGLYTVPTIPAMELLKLVSIYSQKREMKNDENQSICKNGYSSDQKGWHSSSGYFSPHHFGFIYSVPSSCSGKLAGGELFLFNGEL